MTATAEQIVITTPGLYPDLPADVYHADPVPGGSLSSSGARALLPPSCPARYKYDLDHASPPNTTFEVGSAAHKQVLGIGPELVLVDRDRWDTNAVKAEVAEIRDRGAIPLKKPAMQMVNDMADAIRAHPIASGLLSVPGSPEASVFWQRDEVWRRARFDFLPDEQPTGRPIIVEYKTAESAAPVDLDRVMYRFGYHQRAAWYLDAALSIGLLAAYVLVFQEKTPPYLVTVAEPDGRALAIGRDLNVQAVDLYRACVRSGRWPGYSDDVEYLSLPGWVEAQYTKESR